MRNDTEERNPNPNFEQAETDSVAADLVPGNISHIMDEAEEDDILSNSELLTREEVIRRRSRRVKELIKCYKDHYWALMEELKVQHREYYWKYGMSPFVEGNDREIGRGNEGEGSGVTKKRGLGFGDNYSKVGKNKRCTFSGCKSKAMALTDFCHSHILSDSKQKLYKACSYAIKSSPTGPVLCGKPILRSTIPSYCTVHFQKAQKHVTRALKKAGLNVASSSNLAPKFHVIVAESIHQIQAKRRAARKGVVNNTIVKEENNVVVKQETTG